ncbi:hypothetical protein BVC93_17130 [Mycobacterium sp. MS1601]|uniref:FAD:protein FMN transferase n=1 Tax=Mycobacterium sp. MS1601 TaxID=1936029 RepID=UPI0009796AD2|nr:FAD:protein FMN transferase [Mycobacterium sp. MS1601]AQA03865.1 hypothetical protein BVC93_17130 [Mycobacterium sp. MS1601]
MTHLQSVVTPAAHSREHQRRFTFPVSDGEAGIETAQPLAQRAITAITELVQQHHRSFSQSDTDSLLRTISRRDGGSFEFPPEAERLFGLFDAVSAATGGAGAPMMASPDGAHSPSWVCDVAHSGTTLTTRRALSIDVGAAGTGHLVDLVTELLHRLGADDFVINTTNGIRHSGSVPLPIALRHPDDPSLAVGVATVTDQALCATAAESDGSVCATWVVAAEAATANAIGKELFSTPPSRLARYFRFSYIRLFHDGHAEISRTFPGALFTK